LLLLLAVVPGLGTNLLRADALPLFSPPKEKSGQPADTRIDLALAKDCGRSLLKNVLFAQSILTTEHATPDVALPSCVA